LLQRGDGLGTDHAAVGDDADAADAKPRPQPVDHRQEGGDIGGITGPQLAAQRPAVLIHDQPDDHLVEIRAVVLRVAAPAKLGAALSLEGQAGGVHEDHAEFGEQVAPAGKQLLFHAVLAAARRQRAGCGLIGERFAEPSHGAVEMMQLKGLGAVDPQFPSRVHTLLRRYVHADSSVVENPFFAPLHARYRKPLLATDEPSDRGNPLH
jgi:hypothetical protein